MGLRPTESLELVEEEIILDEGSHQVYKLKPDGFGFPERSDLPHLACSPQVLVVKSYRKRTSP